MKLVTRLLVNIISLLAVSYLLPGFRIRDLKTAVIAAIVIGLVNTFIRPLVKIITLPLSILTLGLFSLIVNVLMLMLAAALTPGFQINGFLTAVIASILLSLISSFLNALIKD